MSNEMAAGLQSRTVKTIDWTAPNGEVFTARVPTNAQILIFLTSMTGGAFSESWAAVTKFLKSTFREEGEFDRIYELLEEGEIDLPDIIGDGDELEDDRVPLFTQLTEAVSGGRPTESSDESSSSSGKGGKRSTGRSRGKGSIQSPSRSTGS